MPYIIRKVNGKHQVHKQGDKGQPVGPALGKHRTRTSAVNQLRALYANDDRNMKQIEVAEVENKDFDGPDGGRQYLTGSYVPYGDDDDGDDYVGDYQTPKLDPDDPRVNYDPMGGTKSGACANCFFFDADDSACRLVCGDIVPTGDCDLWLRELSSDEEDEQVAMPVKMVESKELQDVSGSDDETYIVNKRGWLDMVKTAIKQVFGLDEPDEPFSGFKMFGENNEYWAAFYSNNAQDRDKEWFSQKSHDEFIERVDNGITPYPELDFWHCKAYHGQAQWIGREGHITIAVGTFYDTPLAQEMKEYYANVQPGQLLTSFGFYFPRSALVDGVYHAYNAFEISPLPAEVAANLHTGFSSLEEYKEMTMDAQKRKALMRLPGLSPEAAQLIIGAAEQKSKELDTIATSFKTIGNPLEARLDAMADALGLLASQKDTPKSNPGATPKTGKQGQPTTPEEQDDEPADDLDEEDLDNIGSPKSTKESRKIAQLEKQVKQLMRALKAKDDSDTEDDDADQEDDEEDDQPPAKKSRRNGSNVETALKQIGTQHQATTAALAQVAQALTAISQKQTALENGINSVAREIYNPQPASRSPYTVVAPDDPAMAQLAKSMQGMASPDQPPNGMQQNLSNEQLAGILGLPTMFQNGNHRS